MAELKEDKAYKERYKYVTSFYLTMLNIWREQVTLLGVMDTRALLFSIRESHFEATGDFKTASYEWLFNEYGLWQNYGTGREVYRGNPGDIGRAKVREARPWMSKKYYSSLMNIKEFMADNIGKEFLGIFSEALDYDKLRRNSNFYKTHPA